MLEFSGEISDNIVTHMAKKELSGIALMFLLPALFFGVPTLLITLFFDWNDLFILPWFVVALLLFLSLVAFIPPQIPKVVERFANKNTKKTLPKRLTIEDSIIDIDCEAHSFYRSLDDVKKVVDMGAWYHIKFYFPHGNIYFVCQKDLITKGSIEEFEKLFEDKIVIAKSNR